MFTVCVLPGLSRTNLVSHKVAGVLGQNMKPRGGGSKFSIFKVCICNALSPHVSFINGLQISRAKQTSPSPNRTNLLSHLLLCVSIYLSHFLYNTFFFKKFNPFLKLCFQYFFGIFSQKTLQSEFFLASTVRSEGQRRMKWCKFEWTVQTGHR